MINTKLMTLVKPRWLYSPSDTAFSSVHVVLVEPVTVALTVLSVCNVYHEIIIKEPLFRYTMSKLYYNVTRDGKSHSMANTTHGNPRSRVLCDVTVRRSHLDAAAAPGDARPG